MRLLKAQVVDNTDFTEQGRFMVYCKDVSQDYFSVNYVSPYSALHHGGMVAIPEIGVEILITQPDGSDNEWYYIGSIFSPREGIDQSGTEHLDAKNPSVPDREVYRARGKPQRIVISDPLGNKLVLSSSYNPKFFNWKAALISQIGKILELNDSPHIDSILLKNEHGDGIKIISSPQEMSAGRSIELEAKGPLKHISRESEIELLVVEGREIDIVNESTGFNRDMNMPERYGNINIRSKKNDINLTTDDEDGSIYITSLGSGARVQVASNGDIIIHAAKGIGIKAGENLDLKADGNITLDAGGDVNILASGDTNIEGSKVGVKGSSEVAADASQIHLNSGKASGATGTDVQKGTNNYGD